MWHESVQVASEVAKRTKAIMAKVTDCAFAEYPFLWCVDEVITQSSDAVGLDRAGQSALGRELQRKWGTTRTDFVRKVRGSLCAQLASYDAAKFAGISKRQEQADDAVASALAAEYATAKNVIDLLRKPYLPGWCTDAFGASMDSLSLRMVVMMDMMVNGEGREEEREKEKREKRARQRERREERERETHTGVEAW